MRDDLRADIRRGMAVGLLLLVCIIPGALLTSCHRGTPEPPVLPSPAGAYAHTHSPAGSQGYGAIADDAAGSREVAPGRVPGPDTHAIASSTGRNLRALALTSHRRPCSSTRIAHCLRPYLRRRRLPPRPSLHRRRPPPLHRHRPPLSRRRLSPSSRGQPFRSGPSSTTAWCGPTGDR